MSVRREITMTRRRLTEARTVIDRLLAHADGTGKPGHDVLEELMRRGAHVVADGYPSQSMADSDIHGGFAQTGSTSTEKAALRWASESAEDAEAHGREVRPDDPNRHLERDVAGDALRELVSDIDRLAWHAANADNIRKLLVSIETRRYGRESGVVNCPLCGELVTNTGDDRIRSGYCRSCYDAWRRAGSPQDPVERHQFEREWLGKLAERKSVVPSSDPCEHGHLCCSRSLTAAMHDHFRSPAECVDCAAVRGAAKAG